MCYHLWLYSWCWWQALSETLKSSDSLFSLSCLTNALSNNIFCLLSTPVQNELWSALSFSPEFYASDFINRLLILFCRVNTVASCAVKTRMQFAPNNSTVAWQLSHCSVEHIWCVFSLHVFIDCRAVPCRGKGVADADAAVLMPSNFCINTYENESVWYFCCCCYCFCRGSVLASVDFSTACKIWRPICSYIFI